MMNQREKVEGKKVRCRPSRSSALRHNQAGTGGGRVRVQGSGARGSSGNSSPSAFLSMKKRFSSAPRQPHHSQPCRGRDLSTAVLHKPNTLTCTAPHPQAGSWTPQSWSAPPLRAAPATPCREERGRHGEGMRDGSRPKGETRQGRRDKEQVRPEGEDSRHMLGQR